MWTNTPVNHPVCVQDLDRMTETIVGRSRRRRSVVRRTLRKRRNRI